MRSQLTDTSSEAILPGLLDGCILITGMKGLNQHGTTLGRSNGAQFFKSQNK